MRHRGFGVFWIAALAIGCGSSESTSAIRDGSTATDGPATDRGGGAADAGGGAGGSGAGGTDGRAGAGGTAGADGAGGGLDGAAESVDAPTADMPPYEAPPFDAGASRWQIHFIGSGRIDDTASGNPIDLPMARRLHVAMLPEGYTQADLDAGTFDMDVERWMTEVFGIEPYTTFQQAFVVWKIRVASGARIAAADPQTADTAFKLGITSDGGGVGGAGSATAARVWDALKDFPVAITSFGSGRGSRNLVAYMHVLDPRNGRAGLSGRSTTATNPANTSERVSLAIALGRAHEFTHAFSRLSDEYLEDSNTNPRPNDQTTTSSGITNVVASPSCSTVPWRHLFKGTAINPSGDQLVGAFGTAMHGYHAELKCLMNGTHENGKYYGGNGNLRSNDRMCNFCREMTAFRVFERSSVLPDTATSLNTWINNYRIPFFSRYGFKVPTPVPQTSSDGMAWWQPCTP